MDKTYATYVSSKPALTQDEWENIAVTFQQLAVEWREPHKIVIARHFFNRMIENMAVIGIVYTGGSFLGGIPLEIIDDPLAVDYWIDYGDKIVFPSGRELSK